MNRSGVAPMLTEEQEIQLRRYLEVNQLLLVLKPDWNSRNRDHRLNLRSGLKYELEKLRPNIDFSSVLNLEHRPEFPELSISISHCLSLGGFAILQDSQKQIGLDLEVSSRVSSKHISRISRPSERERISSVEPVVIWTAKESAFKACAGIFQPSVVSAIHLKDIKRIDNNAYFFEAGPEKTTLGIKGISYLIGQLCVALSVFSSD